MDLKGIKIGVLGGGVSAEREISLISAKCAYEALRRNGLEPLFIDITTSDKGAVKQLISSFGLDLAFIALHGEFGEDGTVQKILDELDLAYTGSDCQASLLAMNKILSKDIFKKNGITTPDYRICTDKLNIPDGISYPVVVKPHYSGSSLGLSVVPKPADLIKAIELAFSCADKAILEDYIEGRELTVGILDEQPLSVIEIIPKRKYFDFAAKYQDGLSEFIAPADLNNKIYRKVQDLALAAHNRLGCRHFSRVDIRLGQDDVAYILEVNSIPGLTSHSLLPFSAKAAGIDFEHLIIKMAELAFHAKKATQKV